MSASRTPCWIVLLLLGATAPAQAPQRPAYPDRDALSPFREPREVYAPPDRLYALLRRMRALAEDRANPRRFDAQGREVVDHDSWRDAQQEVERLGLDAGYLAQIVRLSKNDADRATAFYAAFWCRRPDHVIGLVEHIPGEPVRAIREAALPRAVAWLRVHLKKRFGDLAEDEKKAVIAALPAPGSPAAKAAGIRAPADADPLHQLRVVPFLQLLDVDAPLDQAQALWFLAEVFALRPDLALHWLEPSLPRVRALLVGDDAAVREQAVRLLLAIGPKDLQPPKPEATADERLAFAEAAARALLPPIRNLNDAVIELHPSPERDAIAAAGRKLLADPLAGDTVLGKTPDGLPYRGFRVAHVPDALQPLAIPQGAIVIAVNGAEVLDAAGLLATVTAQLGALPSPRLLRVEYVLADTRRAVEYRVR